MNTKNQDDKVMRLKKLLKAMTVAELALFRPEKPSKEGK